MKTLANYHNEHQQLAKDAWNSFFSNKKASVLEAIKNDTTPYVEGVDEMFGQKQLTRTIKFKDFGTATPSIMEKHVLRSNGKVSSYFNFSHYDYNMADHLIQASLNRDSDYPKGILLHAVVVKRTLNRLGLPQVKQLLTN